MNYIVFRMLMNSVENSAEFNKLANIGGHKVYHLEGSALKHSFMVLDEARQLMPEDEEMQLVALLHDVGKIYTSVCNGPDDWTYPGHAKAGAENLGKFIPESLPEYKEIKWYIANHIKPLFWRGKDLRKEISAMNCPEGCSVVKLAKLTICDILGSVSVEPQVELLQFLEQFVAQREYAIEEASKFGLEEEVSYLINRGFDPDEALDEWGF